MPTLILSLLNKHKAVFAALMAMILTAGIGFYYGSKTAKPKVVETVVEKIVEKEVIKEVEKKTTQKEKETHTIKHLNGTVEVVEKEKETSTTEKEISQTKEKENNIKKTTEPKMPKYKLGVLVSTSPQEQIAGKGALTYSATTSVRLISSLWGDAAYNFSKKEISLGLSVEF